MLQAQQPAFFISSSLNSYMYGLIEAVYPPKTQKMFESVYSDADSKEQFLMRAVLANALKDVPKSIPSHGTDWLLCTLALHKKSEEDTVRILQAIVRKLPNIQFGLFKQVKTHLEYTEASELADSCLVGLAFFKSKLEHLYQRNAAPSPTYYFNVGSLAFKRLGFESISDDFKDWVDFLEDEFAVTSIV